MLDRKFWWTGGALALTAVVTMILMNLPGSEETVPLQEPISDVRVESSQAVEESEPAPEYAYLLKEYNGRIAVFIPGAEEPQMQFEVLVKFLPDYDRIQLEAGIPVKDYEALSAIIEDYIS